MSHGGGNFLQQVSGGVGGVLSDITGQSAVANSQGEIANAQLGQEQADRQQAAAYAAPTALQMQQLQSAIDTNNTQIQHSKQLLESVDPALMEAGKQALALMQGKSAATLAPIQNQRSQQRQALQQTLAQQLGPDYATSTAGMQALNNFDEQTGNLMTNAQQTTLAQLLGSSQSSAALGQQGLAQGTQGAQNIVNTQGGMQQRQINAILGTPVNPGMQYAGQLAQNSSNATMASAFGNTMLTQAGGMSGILNGAKSLFGGTSAAVGENASIASGGIGNSNDWATAMKAP